jgi:hypothetical protein
LLLQQQQQNMQVALRSQLRNSNWQLLLPVAIVAVAAANSNVDVAEYTASQLSS